jgi:hypothetical protein
MKTRTPILLITLLPLLITCALAVQISIAGWESHFRLTAVPPSQSVISAYSNGYGQHVLTSTVSGGVDYFLLGNDGVPIFSSPDPFPVTGSLAWGAIAGYQNILYAVVGDVNPYELRMFWSTNGGQSWTEATPYPSPGSVGAIDAFADVRGCHIVWNSQGPLYEVNYVLFNRLVGFDYFQQVTGVGLYEGRYPKVVTFGNRLIVSLATTHLQPGENRGATRDADFSGGAVLRGTLIST